MVTTITYSQQSHSKEPSFYVFDADWKGTSMEKAVYLLVVNQEKDSLWRYDTYNITGPLIKSEHFKDKDGNIADGRFIFYNSRGSIDSVEYFSNGLADGTWGFLNDTGRVYLQKEYVKGRLQKTINKIEEDSISRLKAALVKDTIVRIEVESEFKSGIKGWVTYLSKNLRYPDRAFKMQKEGVVKLFFIVDTEGNITEPYIEKSVEYSLDTEALRIIGMSPKWKPAIQNGKNVKSYKKQPINFQLK